MELFFSIYLIKNSIHFFLMQKTIIRSMAAGDKEGDRKAGHFITSRKQK